MRKMSRRKIVAACALMVLMAAAVLLWLGSFAVAEWLGIGHRWIDAASVAFVFMATYPANILTRSD